MEKLSSTNVPMVNDKKLMLKEMGDTCLDNIKESMYVGQDCPILLKEEILKNVRQTKKHCVDDLNNSISEVYSNIITMQALGVYIACYYNRDGVHVCLEDIIKNSYWSENDLKIGFRELIDLGYLVPDEAYSIYQDNYLYYCFHESIEIDT